MVFFDETGNYIWPTKTVNLEALGMTDKTGVKALDFIAKHSLREDKKKYN